MNKIYNSVSKLSVNLQEDSCNLIYSKTYRRNFVGKIKYDGTDTCVLDKNFMPVLRSNDF